MMSDDLVKRLRDTPNWKREEYGDYKYAGVHYDRAPFEAANRIEELEKQNDSLEAKLAVASHNATAFGHKIVALETKLAEATEALCEVSQALDWQAHGACRGWSDNLLTPVNALKLARTAIAKIKGDKP